jgi:hypothetical protein
VESSNMTERGWGASEAPPTPNVRLPEPEVRLAGGVALQWGLASALYSSLLVLLVPLSLLVLIGLTLIRSFDEPGRLTTTILTTLGVFCFDILALVGVGLAVLALRQARDQKQPAALPATGLLLGLGAVLGWALTTAAAVLVLVTIWHS